MISQIAFIAQLGRSDKYRIQERTTEDREVASSILAEGRSSFSFFRGCFLSAMGCVRFIKELAVSCFSVKTSK